MVASFRQNRFRGQRPAVALVLPAVGEYSFLRVLRQRPPRCGVVHVQHVSLRNQRALSPLRAVAVRVRAFFVWPQNAKRPEVP